jgi:hypothetical protein
VSCHSILHVQIGFHWKAECATHIPCATRSMQGKSFLHCHLLYFFVCDDNLITREIMNYKLLNPLKQIIQVLTEMGHLK